MALLTIVASCWLVFFGTAPTPTPIASMCVEFPEFDTLRMNEIQIIGSHNSYKLAPQPELLDTMVEFRADAIKFDYNHVRLRDQLALGLRNLELDLHNDPEGGRYANPIGNRLLHAAGVEPWPLDPDGKLAQPGFKLIHDCNFDFRSTEFLFTDALEELSDWSEANPGHLPVIVTLNLKEGGGDFPGGIEALAFAQADLDRVDEVIKTTMGNERLITPDLVRGDEPDLRSAVTGERGWPEIARVRGRFLFVLDQGGRLREMYLRPESSGGPPLAGRVMFVGSARERDRDAGLLVLNDPTGKGEQRIRNAVAQGFMVRTRADANTVEMRAGDYTRFEAAQRSGASVITTDYYLPDMRHNPRFEIRFSSSVDGGSYVRPRSSSSG